MFHFTMQQFINPRLGPILLSLSAAVLLFGSAAGLWRTFTHIPSIQTTAMPAQQHITRDADHIFGVYQAPLSLAATEKLALQGVFTATDPHSGSAIISTKGQQGKLYVVGDAVPGGATLIAVREFEIELDVNGQHSIVKLPEKHL